jgi:hypothetical protein
MRSHPSHLDCPLAHGCSYCGHARRRPLRPRTAGDGEEGDPERRQAIEAQPSLPDDLEAKQLVEPAGPREEVVARRCLGVDGHHAVEGGRCER